MLWIRNQDKDEIVQVPGITINGRNIEATIGSGFLDGLQINTLGKYETRTRALEIIDEVYQKMESSTDPIVVYTMPEE